jgi:WD40 repeat protein
VTCGQGAPIFFWDCDEVNPVAQLEYSFKVLTLQISPSGKHMAFGTETNEVYVYAMNGINGFECLGKGIGHSGPVTKLKWSPDEKQIISGSTDSSVCVWNFYG